MFLNSYSFFGIHLSRVFIQNNYLTINIFFMIDFRAKIGTNIIPYCNCTSNMQYYVVGNYMTNLDYHLQYQSLVHLMVTAV